MNTPPSDPPHTTAKSDATAVAFYSAQDYKSGDSIGYLMRRIINHLSRELDREFEPLGLTNAQWVPLLKMHLGCGSTAAELARECENDAGSMTRLLDRLEAKALCYRVRSSEDRRVVHIALTPAGQKAAEGIPVILSKLQNEYLAGFSLEEWQTLKGYLHRILDTAQALQAPKDKHEI